MIINNNIVIADKGKYLLYEDTPFQELKLGLNLLKINNKVEWHLVDLNSLLEALPIELNGLLYYLKAKDYSTAISELIHTKYSIDDELALMANARIGKTNKEEEYLSWRQYCKNIAKKIYE